MESVCGCAWLLMCVAAHVRVCDVAHLLRVDGSRGSNKQEGT